MGITVRIVEVFELWRFNSYYISLQETNNKDRIKESSNCRDSNYGDSTVFMISIIGSFELFCSLSASSSTIAKK